LPSANLVPYSYHFETDEAGRKQLVSQNYEWFGDVCELFAHAVEERKKAGLSFDREEAELAGLGKLSRRWSKTTKLPL